MGPIQSLQCNPLGSGSLYLQWEPPKFFSKDSLKFQIKYAIGNEASQDDNTFLFEDSRVKLEGLESNTKYYITIYAMTKDGQVHGKENSITCQTTHIGSPDEPDFDLTVMYSTSSNDKVNVIVKWTPDLQRGHPGSTFKVEWCCNISSDSYQTTWPEEQTNILSDEVVVSNLTAGNNYTFKVVVFDDNLSRDSQAKEIFISNRPARARFETSSAEDILEEEYSTETEIQCSVPCGEGVKTKITMTCQRTCFPDCCQRKVEEIPCEITRCENTFGPWSEWSECSKACISNIGERSIKSRIRVCIECNEDVNGISTLVAFKQLFLVL